MTAGELFERLSAPHVDSGMAERGKIFHSTGLKSGDHFFAFVREDEIVMKLPAQRVAELIADGAGRQFDARRGRPMREWVCIHAADVSSCERLLEEARQFVASASTKGDGRVLRASHSQDSVSGAAMMR
jgi:hypothetical protein